MARKKADVTIVVVKNDSYGILNIELARVREGDPIANALDAEHYSPSLDWGEARRGLRCSDHAGDNREGVAPAVRSCLSTKGPQLIEAQLVQNLKPD
jgi:acetolactate synthase I/II/III large subunit